MVVDSSSDEQVTKRKPKKINLAASLDSDIEEIESPKEKESPKEELGEFSIVINCFIKTYRNFEERMAKDWTSPIYGFFESRPLITVIEGRRCHEFKCAAPHCKGKGVRARFVRRYLDKADRGSTSNMHKHAKICWGVEIVSKALQTKNELTIKEVRKSLSEAKLQDGTITALFERNGKETVSFSMKQHTYMETRSVKIYNEF